MNGKLCFDLVSFLREKNIKISTAESCTGGLLSKYITDQPGASEIFECGVVSYSGKIKNKLLSVSEETLSAYGEVSDETAREMAVGVRALAQSDLSVGITGIAGPGGGSEAKPVGLVYFAVSYRDEVRSVRLELFDLGDRSKIREATVECVLRFILNWIQ